MTREAPINENITVNHYNSNNQPNNKIRENKTKTLFIIKEKARILLAIKITRNLGKDTLLYLEICNIQHRREEKGDYCIDLIVLF